MYIEVTWVYRQRPYHEVYRFPEEKQKMLELTASLDKNMDFTNIAWRAVHEINKKQSDRLGLREKSNTLF